MHICQAKDWDYLPRTVGPTMGFCRFERGGNEIRFKFQEDCLHLGSCRKNRWAMQNGKKNKSGLWLGNHQAGLCPWG